MVSTIPCKWLEIRSGPILRPSDHLDRRALSHQKHAKKPVIVMNYRKDIKAFYMRVNDDGGTVAAMDVLAPGIGEIIGGSQREERLPTLDARMTERGIDKDHYAWYHDLRRYGTVPHAGFGLGFKRTLAYVTGLANVRDATPFPRTPGNARY
jgi:asparaginyl-tRNA synthetase